jgi:NADH:ubiquinone oxidoreductase subunit E
MIPEITICMGSSCFARGNEKNLEIIEQFLAERQLEDEVNLQLGCSLCRGNCSIGPNIKINDLEYHKVDPGMMYEILKKYFDNRVDDKDPPQ